MLDNLWFHKAMTKNLNKNTRDTLPLCIAHRGARQEAPENTWSAFEKALAYPIDGIEFDVQMSKDGVPFLYHDDTLWRISRQRKRVGKMPFTQLERMDWGCWFDPAFQGEPLMTLEGLLDRAAHAPLWLVEIKSSPRDKVNGHACRLAGKVVDLIKKAGGAAIANRLMILSFDARVLATAHAQAPDLRYVLNLSGKETMASLETLPITPDQLWAVDIHIGRLSLAHVQWARAHQIKVYTYTCNGPRQLSKALKLKVDAIISDRPGWLTQRIKGDAGN